ncbi:TPR-like protein, partial [Setomelanomma holmii]
LDRADQLCAAPDSRAALVGLGGVSKSQLAIEYAYCTHKQSPETWVFWVHASNAARFEQSYRDIADRVRIAGRRDPQANICKLVHDWLCDCKQRWLLVLDNVDDARFLLDVRSGGGGQATNARGAARPLREYLPHREHGSILITTRNKEATLELVEQRNIVSVKPMDEAQALALFEKKLGGQGGRGEGGGIAQLAAALEYMPLAVVQAAAYISRSATRCSVAQYLDEFRRSDCKKTSLLNHEAGQLRRDREANNSIIITWQISFEHLQRNRRSAADLLSLMSFFDRQGIPEALIHDAQGARRGSIASDRTERSLRRRIRLLFSRTKSRPKAQREHKESDGDEVEFENDVVALRDPCFISVDTDGATFEMHALVQLATRMWLEANGSLEQWKQQFVSNHSAVFPTGEYEIWAVCQALFAHARSAVGQPPKDKSSLAEWASLRYRAAWYAEGMGNTTDAVTLAIESMKARKNVLGQEHKDTLSSMAMVGSAYRLGGRWEDAEKLEVQVMETHKTKLGADHSFTLISMANLALTYWNQGRWEDAEELEVQVMETRKMKPGADHPSTLSSMNNLASTYQSQRRWDAAEELQVQVTEMSKTKLGVDHPNTLTSIANLAATYSNQGRLDDAEKLFIRVIETRKTKLGADHPDTLNSMTSLAVTWKAQGRSVEAIVLMRQCVQQRQRVLKAGHPDLESSLTVLEQWEVE